MAALLPLLVFGPMAASLVLILASRFGLPHRARNHLVCAVTAVLFAGAIVCTICFLRLGAWSWRLGAGIQFHLDGFRAVYLCVTTLLWVVTTLFSGEYFGEDRSLGSYYSFCLLTLGATLGVFLSADFFTTFLFFEMLSFVSYPLVVHDRRPASMRAGETYLAVAVIGGMVMLMGMFLLYHRFGTLSFQTIYSAVSHSADRSGLYLPGALLIVGFGAKAGMFPLHIWLPKAHPVAPAPASALLSGILTKTGVFGVLIVSSTLFLHDANWGLGLLLPAVVTMVWGAVLALLSVDMKRILACSSVSQIGFILVGVAMQGLLGDHNALAVRGTILHMINHSLLKLVLFLLAGVVYRNLHKLHLNDIRGFGRGKPLFALLFAMGALGITGVPLWNGYLSKTLLHESIVEAVHLFPGLPLGSILQGVEYLFLFTGGLTVAYMLKLACALFAKVPGAPPAARRPYLSRPSAVALTACALLLPLLGSFPGLADAVAAISETFVYGHPPNHAVHYFSWENLRGAVISLAIGAALYMVVVRSLLMRGREYIDRLPRWLDLETALYRPLLRALVAVGAFFARLAETLPDALVRKVVSGPLRQSLPDERVSPFYARFYWLIYPRPGKPPRERILPGTLTYALLLFSLGLSALLLCVALTA